MFKSFRLNELFTLLLLTLERTKFRDFRLLGKKAKIDTHENWYLYIFITGIAEIKMQLPKFL